MTDMTERSPEGEAPALPRASSGVQSQVLARYRWRKVEVPRTWRPRAAGEVIVGYYAGRTKRQGAYGPYEVVLVLVPGEGAFMISGVRLIQLVDAAMIGTGHPICITYQGDKDLGGGQAMKLFDVSVADGDPIDEGALPTIGGPARARAE